MEGYNMQECIRKDRNGIELNVGDKVNVYCTVKVVGSGEVKQPVHSEAWANRADIVWIEWETANRDLEQNIGRILWSSTFYVEKIIEKEEIKQMKPHVHTELIKLWADDPSIKFQYRYKGDTWRDLIADPSWNRTLEYRVKPKEKKFVDKYRYTCENQHGVVFVTDDKYSDKEWESFIKELGITQYVRLDFSLTKVEVKED